MAADVDRAIRAAQTTGYHVVGTCHGPPKRTASLLVVVRWLFLPAALGVIVMVVVQPPDVRVATSSHSDGDDDDNGETVDTEMHLDLMKQAGSSVACEGADVLRRTCAFRYLCFNPATGDFALVRPGSVGSQVAADVDPDDLPWLPPALPPLAGAPLAEERSRGVAHLSTVGEHAQHALQLVDVDGASLHGSQVVFVGGGPTFVMRRFKPDNLMHALHDDLLPLFREIRKLLPSLRRRRVRRPLPKQAEGRASSMASAACDAGGCEKQQQESKQQGLFPVRLFFADDHGELAEPTDSEALYAAMSDRKPLTRFDLMRLVLNGNDTGSDDSSGTGGDGARLVCFEEAYAGFDRSTLWYQYGFEAPQGSLPLSASVRDDLHEFARYVGSAVTGKVWQRLQPEPADWSASSARAVGGHVLLLCRRGNRLILNEDELALALARACGCRVHVAAAETHSLAELLSLVRDARALVGMHGALLSLAAFAQPGAVLIELFPYALRPELYTPYATLADVAGLHYVAWRNTDRSATRGHAHRPRELGGLVHLTPAERQRVLDVDEVTPHRCCSDPSWLYHVYQDTTVDSAAVARSLVRALEHTLSQLLSPQQQQQQQTLQTLPPGTTAVRGCLVGVVAARPRAVVCYVNGSQVSVSWQAPWNAGRLGCQRGGAHTYEVVWHGLDGQERVTAFVAGHGHSAHYSRQPSVNVWVRLNDGGATVGLWSRYTACEAAP